jgi:hypothetical protein
MLSAKPSWFDRAEKIRTLFTHGGA